MGNLSTGMVQLTMKQKVFWWQWLIAVCMMLILLFTLKNIFLTEQYITPPVARTNGLTDEQVKQKQQDEVDTLRHEMEKHNARHD